MDFSSYTSCLRQTAVGSIGEIPPVSACLNVGKPAKESSIISFENLKESTIQISSGVCYKGCNAEELESGHKIPRTLYHLFFIYFSLKERAAKKESFDYALIDFPKGSYRMDSLQDLTCNDSYKILYETVRAIFHKEIVSLYNDNSIGLNPTWEKVVNLINIVWDSFPDFNELPNDSSRNFSYTFYRFIYRKQTRERAKNIILKCIATEWVMPREKTLFYRSGTLSREHIINSANGNQHSLSFGSSPLSGAVFEGGSVGTCPLVYQLEHEQRDLYALSLSLRKVTRYFFNPQILKGLYPLLAIGEFSHQRLNVFPTAHSSIEAVQGRTKEAKELIVFDLEKKPTIKSLEDYSAKVRKIFSKHIIVLDRYKSK